MRDTTSNRPAEPATKLAPIIPIGSAPSALLERKLGSKQPDTDQPKSQPERRTHKRIFDWADHMHYDRRIT